MAKKTDSPFHEIRHAKKRAYLSALVETGGNVTRACEIAQIDRSTPYTDQWAGDGQFQDALERAKTMGVDHLEAEAVRRAYEGVREPVGWHKGEPGGYVQKYSDTLLIFLLKGAKPEKYAEQHRVTGADGGPIEYREVTDDELVARARQLTNRVAALSVNGKKNGKH